MFNMLSNFLLFAMQRNVNYLDKTLWFSIII
ncbi:hypothetical protein HMPREF1212_01611 [Parabacteroides sp. HGS0025]|uniref:Uncharacterized protein n=1 Tax=Parabacteroides gordonii MS-1 = DSM 23371 TaxID=1203610 RepID=A0A0F5ISP7_9BACT|nr:hypothetical protein HMPREF1536_04809 [Parabacteroides gordonii MS-1 = DSM 23371]KKB50884.1 hypothetical protein HMPREF1212_01611 [Parabacteroides sp. HGS0025]